MAKKYIDQKVELDVSSTLYPALCLFVFLYLFDVEVVRYTTPVCILEWDKNRRLFGES